MVFSPSETDHFLGGKRLANRRRKAAERAVATGIPSFTEEVWRYSQIDELDLDRYELFVPHADGGVAGGEVAGETDEVAGGVATAQLGPFVAQTEPAALISIVNGAVVAASVHVPGVTLRTLAANYDQASTQAGKAATGSMLGRVMTQPVDFFAEANLAFTSAPVVVEIAPGATVDGPILVCSYTDADRIMWFPRLVVIAGENSNAVVVEQHTSADVECLVCPITELDLAEQAQLSHITVQQMGARAWQIATQSSQLANEARLASQNIALGGGYARARIDTTLLGERSHSDLTAIYFGNGETALDFRTYQRHVAPNTTSNLLFKGALDDYSRAVYTGLIRIEKTASGVEAFQTNRNLKLSPNAWAESVPNLEIENNDVKCSHASATGPVDPDQRFYLERLGVPSDAAELLVVQGFFDEVLDTLPIKQIGVVAGEHISTLLAGRLAAMA